LNTRLEENRRQVLSKIKSHENLEMPEGQIKYSKSDDIFHPGMDFTAMGGRITLF
jgi:hypothetical protein